MKKKTNDVNFPDLCIKSFTGNASKEENALIDKWIEESDLNRAEYSRIEKIWKRSSFFEGTELPDINTEWTEINNNLNAAEKEIRKIPFATERKNVIIKLRPVFGAALIVIAVVVFYILNFQKDAVKINTVSTGPGQHSSVELSDGSHVILNDNSEIIFPEVFKGKSREIRLKGEAFFSVSKLNKPFIVITNNAKTTVLGTQFSVWSRGNETKVIVKEGIVTLSPAKETEESVRLTKNMLSIVKGKKAPTDPRKVNAGFLLGWTEGKLVFDRTSLKNVIRELEKYYKIRIDLKDGKLADLTMTGSFQNMSADSVISAVCLALNLKYAYNDGIYDIETK